MEHEAFVDKIVARVMALLAGEPLDLSPRNVLMLFNGASTGFVVGMEAIRRLAGSKHSLTVMLTPAAAHIITESQVRQAGASKVVGAGEWVDTPALVKRSDLVLVPTMSMNLAARLALGLMDSPIATVILAALLAGKPVIAIKDGADPGSNAGRVFDAKVGAAPALHARLAGNLATLASYGAELVCEGEFLLAVERRLIAGGAPQTVAVPVTHTNGSVEQRPWQANRHANGAMAGIVTEADLLALHPGSIVHFAAGSRLTPQAQDTARRLGLKLELV
jgi:hypothetical protein